MNHKTPHVLPRLFALCLALASAGFAASSTAEDLHVEMLATPAGDHAMTPFVASGKSGAYLSWLETSGDGHTLWLAKWDGRQWGPRRVIHRSVRFFANWADFSSVSVTPSGRVFAHWLEMAGEGSYEYDAWFVWSDDEGMHWSSPDKLHADDTLSEHGFVSMLPREESGFRAVWLDARDMKQTSRENGGMTLRYVDFDGTALGPEVLLDSRVCECCQTAFASSGEELVVAFRDRSDEEIRDIGIKRRVHGVWSQTRPAHVDGWEISGCPVNGPQLASRDRELALAWFTAEGDRPRTQIIFSQDFGRSFSDPVVLDGQTAMGRVDVEPFASEFAVVFLTRSEDASAQLVLALVDERGVSSTKRLGETGASRASGFPRMVRFRDDLLVSWTESYERGGDAFLKLAIVSHANSQSSPH